MSVSYLATHESEALEWLGQGCYCDHPHARQNHEFKLNLKSRGLCQIADELASEMYSQLFFSPVFMASGEVKHCCKILFKTRNA